jgi:c-di-GMP-binding flagellar brake protein YcgR
MQERREFVRLDTRLEATYTALPSGTPQPLVSKNVSGGGICFVADQQLPPGLRLQISLPLPGRALPVNFLAEVVWCEAYEMIGRTQRRRSIEVGVCIVEIAPQDREAILQHVILTMQPRPPKIGDRH